MIFNMVGYLHPPRFKPVLNVYRVKSGPYLQKDHFILVLVFTSDKSTRVIIAAVLYGVLRIITAVSTLQLF